MVDDCEIKTKVSPFAMRTQEIKVFDVYQNIDNANKSLAYNLTFSSDEKTLTDEEVMHIFNNIIEKVTTTLNITLRDK